MEQAPRYKCLNCMDQGWVCIEHPNMAYDVPGGCACVREGTPCQFCNPCDRDNPPWLQPGWESKASTRQ